MIWLNIARVGKVLALLLFLLPWLVVSCNSAPLIEMSGVDMAIGKAEPAADSPLANLARQAENDAPTAQDGEGSPAMKAEQSEGMKLARLWVPAGAALILIGLVLSFVLRPVRKGAIGALAGAVAAMAVLGGGMAWTTSEFRSSMNEATAQPSASADPGASSELDAMGRDMAEAMAKAIRLEIKPGYWLTLAALLGAAAAAFMAMSGRALPGVTITFNSPKSPET